MPCPAATDPGDGGRLPAAEANSVRKTSAAIEAFSAKFGAQLRLISSTHEHTP
jgi:hypothetical protein